MRNRMAMVCALAGVTAAVAPTVASARPVAETASKPVITMSGSTSVAPLAVKLIKG
jgi:ABC-type phosphate transport system substrate-binding protein